MRAPFYMTHVLHNPTKVLCGYTTQMGFDIHKQSTTIGFHFSPLCPPIRNLWHTVLSMPCLIKPATLKLDSSERCVYFKLGHFESVTTPKDRPRWSIVRQGIWACTVNWPFFKTLACDMNHLAVLSSKTPVLYQRPRRFWSDFKWPLYFFLFPVCCIISLNNKVWLKVCPLGLFFLFSPHFVCLVGSYACNFLLSRDKCGGNSVTKLKMYTLHLSSVNAMPCPAGDKEIHCF